MRIRSLLAVLAAAMFLAVGPAGPAGAVEAEDLGLTEEQFKELQGDLTKFEFKCLAEQLEQIDHARAGEPFQGIRTCEESPNPILPKFEELVWAIVSFAILFAVLARFAFPAIRRGLERREQGIRDEVEAAEKAKQDAEETLRQYEEQLADARSEAARIIEEAREAADAMRRDLQASAEADAQTARERAEAEIDQTVARARADLQRQVADFAVELAERIVERNLDRDAQLALIDSYIEEVGGMSTNGGSPSDN